MTDERATLAVPTVQAERGGPVADPAETLDQLVPRIRLLQAEMAKVIIGQEEIISAVLYALFSRGHCLLVGVPGLAKTLLVHTLARSLELSFSRIQFTPDLMPSDITGTEILEEDAASGHRRFVFNSGRCSRRSYWPMKSTGRRPRRRPPCWRRCRKRP